MSDRTVYSNIHAFAALYVSLSLTPGRIDLMFRLVAVELLRIRSLFSYNPIRETKANVTVIRKHRRRSSVNFGGGGARHFCPKIYA